MRAPPSRPTNNKHHRHRLPPACNPCDFFLELVSKTPPPPGSSPLHSPLHSPIHQQQIQLFSAGARGGDGKATDVDEPLGCVRFPLNRFLSVTSMVD